jgi:hypothetical protein
MKKLTLLLSIVLATISCFGQITNDLSYDESETMAISAFQNNNADSAIMILESALKKFPEEFARTTNILAYIYTRTNNLSKAIEIWEMDFAINNYFPATGLVLNCPVIPEDVTDDMTRQFVAQHKKLGIITGENDFALEGQKKLVRTIDSLSGQTKIIVTKGLGHSFAENFSQTLDEYLNWVIE